MSAAGGDGILLHRVPRALDPGRPPISAPIWSSRTAPDWSGASLRPLVRMGCYAGAATDPEAAFRDGASQAVVLRSPRGATARVSMHGRQVVSWSGDCGEELLFTSSKYWKDRLLRAKALGLNTIQTYVLWNLHEPEPRSWEFRGFADIESYLGLAHDLEMLVMLRVDPYICGRYVVVVDAGLKKKRKFLLHV